MNVKQYSQLKEAEKYLNQAFYGNYLKSMPRTSVDLVEAYYKEKNPNKYVNKACSACVLNMCKEVGKEYFEFQNKLKNRTTKNISD